MYFVFFFNQSFYFCSRKTKNVSISRYQGLFLVYRFQKQTLLFSHQNVKKYISFYCFLFLSQRYGFMKIVECIKRRNFPFYFLKIVDIYPIIAGTLSGSVSSGKLDTPGSMKTFTRVRLSLENTVTPFTWLYTISSKLNLSNICSNLKQANDTSFPYRLLS